MIELQKGQTVPLVKGGAIKVIEELGRGGQGIVYKVEHNGEYKALKWYINNPGQDFYNNLEENIEKGSPSDAFIWPEYLTKKLNGVFGYVMKLRPQGYYEFGNFLLARKSFKSFNAMLNAAMKVCNGFKMLHRYGYSYQDLNDGNFFINPDNGDVLICDNDNVMPQGDNSGIMGKSRYMAPEVVIGKSNPGVYSDRFSLSVILFLLFFANHPLEGAKVASCPCLTEKFDKQFFGSEALFIFDPNDNSNRPVKGLHNNVIRRWPIFPKVLKDRFIEEFSTKKINNPTSRIVEADWERTINQVRDELVICPKCGEETFVYSKPECMNCKNMIAPIGKIRINNRVVYLTEGTPIFLDNDNNPDCKVIKHPKIANELCLQNITGHPWVVETPSGKTKQVENNDIMPVKPGLKINFGIINNNSIKGEIIN